MRSRLIILSDLWGSQDNGWIRAYTEALQDQFSITYFDARQLAQIDPELKKESDIHSTFVNGGIDRAVHNLCHREQESVTVLAFSIGGTIGWKAAMAGLKVRSIYALSSTRLRHENEQPTCNITLFYGENDDFKPNQDWFDQQGISPFIFEGMDHEMYKSPTVINHICNHIKLNQLPND